MFRYQGSELSSLDRDASQNLNGETSQIDSVWRRATVQIQLIELVLARPGSAQVVPVRTGSLWPSHVAEIIAFRSRWIKPADVPQHSGSVPHMLAHLPLSFRSSRFLSRPWVNLCCHLPCLTKQPGKEGISS